MAEGVWVNDGLKQRLKDVLNNPITQLQEWSFLLFVNNITPNRSTLLTDLVEPTWSGYARRGLTASVWTTPVQDGDFVVSTWGVDGFTYTNTDASPTTVYGWAIWDSGLGQLVFAQRFDDVDIRPIGTGEPITVLPRVSLASLAP